MATQFAREVTRLTLTALDHGVAWIDRVHLGFRRFFHD